MIAASVGNEKACKYLLPYLRNKTDKNGKIATVYAAEYGHVRCLRILLAGET